MLWLYYSKRFSKMFKSFSLLILVTRFLYLSQPIRKKMGPKLYSSACYIPTPHRSKHSIAFSPVFPRCVKQLDFSKKDPQEGLLEIPKTSWTTVFESRLSPMRKAATIGGLLLRILETTSHRFCISSLEARWFPLPKRKQNYWTNIFSKLHTFST